MLNRIKIPGAVLCLLTTVTVAGTSTTSNNKEAVTIPELETWVDPVRETSDNGTAVLIIPMTGQMGSDVNPEVYKELEEEIRAANPDLILIELDSEGFTERSPGIDPLDSASNYDFDMLVELVRFFRVELEEIPQVLWIKQASTSNSTLAFAWHKVYMSNNATLSGTMDLALSVWEGLKEGAETRFKFREHVTAHIKNFTALSRPYDSSLGQLDPDPSKARHSEYLGMSFLDPDVIVSGSWNGKNVIWQLGIGGDFTLDGGEGVPRLSAILAEELAITDATVNNRHDVLYCEGIHEYYVVGQDVTDEIEDQRKSWRKDLERARGLLKDSEQFNGWATGELELYYRLKQLDAYKNVLRLMEKWPGLSMRIGWEFQIGKPTLKAWIKQLEKQIRQLRRNKKDSDRGGGSPRGGGGLGG